MTPFAKSNYSFNSSEPANESHHLVYRITLIEESPLQPAESLCRNSLELSNSPVQSLVIRPYNCISDSALKENYLDHMLGLQRQLMNCKDVANDYRIRIQELLLQKKQLQDELQEKSNYVSHLERLLEDARQRDLMTSTFMKEVAFRLERPEVPRNISCDHLEQQQIAAQVIRSALSFEQELIEDLRRLRRENSKLKEDVEELYAQIREINETPSPSLNQEIGDMMNTQEIDADESSISKSSSIVPNKYGWLFNMFLRMRNKSSPHLESTPCKAHSDLKFRLEDVEQGIVAEEVVEEQISDDKLIKEWTLLPGEEEPRPPVIMSSTVCQNGTIIQKSSFKIYHFFAFLTHLHWTMTETDVRDLELSLVERAEEPETCGTQHQVATTPCISE